MQEQLQLLCAACSIKHLSPHSELQELHLSLHTKDKAVDVLLTCFILYAVENVAIEVLIIKKLFFKVGDAWILS